MEFRYIEIPYLVGGFGAPAARMIKLDGDRLSEMNFKGFLVLLLGALTAGVTARLSWNPVNPHSYQPPVVLASRNATLDEALLGRAGKLLVRHPELAHDGKFMARHPEVRSYLDAHPEFRDQLVAEARVRVESRVNYFDQERDASRWASADSSSASSSSKELNQSDVDELADLIATHRDVDRVAQRDMSIERPDSADDELVIVPMDRHRHAPAGRASDRQESDSDSDD